MTAKYPEPKLPRGCKATKWLRWTGLNRAAYILGIGDMTNMKGKNENMRLHRLLDADPNIQQWKRGPHQQSPTYYRRLVRAKRQTLVNVCVALVAVVAMTGSALSQQRTIYGSDGRVQGRIATDSQGSQTIYDAGGRVTGRTSTDSQGTTRVYDSGGRSVGTITGPRK